MRSIDVYLHCEIVANIGGGLEYRHLDHCNSGAANTDMRADLKKLGSLGYAWLSGPER